MTPTGRGGKGTFRETWQLAWQPDFAVDLVEAGAYGTTVHSAADAKVRETAAAAGDLATLTGLVEQCLLAGLSSALPPVLRALDDRVAADSDVAHLLAAIPALVRTMRYGDVRGTDVGALWTVTTGLLVRSCAGLPAAVVGLDDDAAQRLATHIDNVQTALGLLADDAGADAAASRGDELRGRWLDTLGRLAGRDDLHGVLSGRLTRILYDTGRLDIEETARRMGLALTVGVAPGHGASWVAGFLSGGGLLLVHDRALLGLLDRWLAAIPADSFVATLPLLRRTFGAFAAPERRAIGEQVKRGGVGGVVDTGGRPDEESYDPDRGAVPLDTVVRLLGLEVAAR